MAVVPNQIRHRHVAQVADDYTFNIHGHKVKLEDHVPTRPPTGDGGELKHRFANAALSRRGDVHALDEELRIYDHHEKREWRRKYRNFSAKHMRSDAFKQFTQARHDPLNKSPAWAKKVLHNMGEACKKNAITPRELFEAACVERNGQLSREEMRRVLLGFQHDLSDSELTVIFDEVDASHAGALSVDAFCSAVEKSTNAKVAEAEVRRNPVHTQPRYAPCEDERAILLSQDAELVTADRHTLQAVEERLRKVVEKKHKKEKDNGKVSKYHFFSTSGRFLRASKRKPRLQAFENGETIFNAAIVRASPVPVDSFGKPSKVSFADPSKARHASSSEPSKAVATTTPLKALSQNAGRWVWDSRTRKKALIRPDETYDGIL